LFLKQGLLLLKDSRKAHLVPIKDSRKATLQNFQKSYRCLLDVLSKGSENSVLLFLRIFRNFSEAFLGESFISHICCFP